MLFLIRETLILNWGRAKGAGTSLHSSHKTTLNSIPTSGKKNN